MAANELIENKDKKKVVKNNHLSWDNLVEQNRLGKCYSVAEQIVLLAIEWNIPLENIDSDIIKVVSELAKTIAQDSLKQEVE